MGHWVNSVLRGFTQARQGVVAYIGVRVGSLWHDYNSWWSFWFARVSSGVPSDRCVHSGSRGFSPASLVVVQFIHVGWINSDALWGRPVHSGSG